MAQKNGGLNRQRGAKPDLVVTSRIGKWAVQAANVGLVAQVLGGNQAEAHAPPGEMDMRHLWRSHVSPSACPTHKEASRCRRRCI
jgi:hypothetical protein